MAFEGLSMTSADAWAADAPVGDVSRTAESIHQEVVIAATPARVYDALTDAVQFTTVTTFSSVPKASPAIIGRSAGAAFSVFGGHIVGRQLELVPAQRIVQAWRVVDWEPGHYSIAKFEFRNENRQTRILFDHTGFPGGQGNHLAEGWTANYWEPLKKYFT
jgi:activator of HSP90 ATPase